LQCNKISSDIFNSAPAIEDENDGARTTPTRPIGTTTMAIKMAAVTNDDDDDYDADGN